MRTTDAPSPSASRTDSDGGQSNFLESGRRRTPDAPSSSASRTDSDRGRSNIFPRRTEADGGRTSFVRFKDGFGRRTGKFLRKRTEADAGRRRTKSVPRALIHGILNEINERIVQLLRSIKSFSEVTLPAYTTVILTVYVGIDRIHCVGIVG